MDDRIRLKEMILATSVAINLILTAIVVNSVMRYPYNIDLIRVQYLEDAKMYYTRGCLDGTDYPPEYRLPTPGYNENSTVNWCNNSATEREQLFMGGMYNLGKRDFR